jgi:pimeloyl-[acyl-carrier protein] methyl ester esterase
MNDKGIVFLHGWGTNAGVFARQLDVFKDDFNVIAPDIYGLIPEGSNGSFPLDAAVDAIADNVVKSNIKRLLIVGWSFGGIIAARLSEKLAGITKGVVFCGFSPVFAKSGDNPYGMDCSAIKRLKKRIEKSAVTAIEEFLKLVMYGCQDTPDFQTMKGIILDKISKEKKKALLSSLSLLEHEDYTKDVKAVKARTLVIHGTGDRLCRLEAVKAMSNLIRDCRVEIIKGASHVPFFTNADDFNKILKEFIHDLD